MQESTLQHLLTAGLNGGYHRDDLDLIAGLDHGDIHRLVVQFSDDYQRPDVAERTNRIWTAGRMHDAYKINRLARANADTNINGSATASVNLPAAVWESSPVLRDLRAYAHAEGAPADPAFGMFLARTASVIPPSVTLPSITGSLGTLDFMMGIIGRSGAGKGAAGDVASRFLDIDDDQGRRELPLGSGEGVVDAYFSMVTEPDMSQPPKKNGDPHMHKVKKQSFRAVMFGVDEGGTFGKLGDRTGATLWSVCKTAWSGRELGQSNATEERTRQLKARSYRFVLAGGWQLDYATDLLADVVGGMPQRFLYLWAIDPRPRHPQPFTGKLLTISPSDFTEPLTVDPTVREEIADEYWARSSIPDLEVEPLDSHRNLLRLKVAGILSVIDGLDEIDPAHWATAGLVMNTSDAVRAKVIDRAMNMEHELTQRAVKRTLAATTAVDSARERRQDVAAVLSSMVNVVARHEAEDDSHPEPGCPPSCLRKAARNDRRHANDDAMAKAVAEGRLVERGGRWFVP